MIKKILLISILAVSSISLFSQNILNSPYSRYGFGDLQDENYMSIRQMGGLGSSWADGFHTNNANPASLPFLRATAYEVGIDAANVTLDDGNQSTNQWGGKFNYLGIAFPLFNPINELYEQKKRDLRFGMAFNLSRKSTVGYNITSIDSTDNLGVFNRNYIGEGGSYEFSWSNGAKYKDFSFGVKLGYLFGNTTYSRTVSFDGKDYPYNNNFEDAFFIKAFTYNVGFMYTKIFGDKDEKNLEKLKRLTIGVRANSGSKFRTVADQTAFGIQVIPQEATFVDTVYSVLDTIGSGFIPGTIGIGANYLIGNRWGMGFEFNTSPWSKYYHELKGDVKNELRDAMSVSFGGFYRPDYKSYNSYFKRMSYRFGAYYNKDPRMVDGKGVDQYGLTFGLGLPFIYQRSGSNASLGIDFGRRGQGTIIEEKYIKLNFGFTFNDEGWFIKRKYN